MGSVSEAQLLAKFAKVIKAVLEVEVMTVRDIAKRIEGIKIAAGEGRDADAQDLTANMFYDVLTSISQTTFDANAIALSKAALKVRDVEFERFAT